MIRVVRIWQLAVFGGFVVGSLSGCGKNEPKAATPSVEVASVPTQPVPAVAPKSPPTTRELPPIVLPPPAVPSEPDAGPKASFTPPPTAAPEFTPPTSATFNPPAGKPNDPPKTNLTGFESPAPQPPPPQPPVQTPPVKNPPVGTPPDANPPPAGGTPPGPGGSLQTQPKEQEYPKEIGGHDLAWYLKEISIKLQPDPQQREAAIRTIPLFGPSAREPAVRPLTNVLYEETDPGVLIAAISVISNMGFDVRREVKPAITGLVSLLAKTGNGSSLRMYCVRSLASFGPDAVSAVKNLRSIAGDPSWETRMAIAEALGSIGMPPKADGDPDEQAAKTLLDYLLRDNSVAVRLEAVKSLLAIGPPKAKNPVEYKTKVKPYLDSLDKRIDAEKGRQGKKTVYVWLLLLQIMYDDRTLAENVQKLAKLIETPEGTDAAMVRMYALQALGLLGPPAAPAVPNIIPALGYPEPELQIAAMVALARIGNEARAAVPELEKIKAMPPKVPEGAKEGTKPDDTLQKMAADTIDYITGKKKIGDAPPPAPKGDKVGEK